MNRLLVPAFILGMSASGTFAADSDPGYGARTTSQTAPRTKARATAPAYFFKPTMRYYGKGYTIAYRYVQWNDRLQRSATTTFSSGMHNIPAGSAGDVASQEPRVVVYHGPQPQPQSQAPVVEQLARSAVKSPAKEVPQISGSSEKK